MTDKMFENFEYIRTLDSSEQATLEQLVNKLTEELGEIASDVNVLTGYKRNKGGKAQEEIKANLKEECCDLIQLAMCLGARTGMDYNELCETIAKKNVEWQSSYASKQ